MNKTTLLWIIWLSLIGISVIDYFSTYPHGGHWFGWYIFFIAVAWGMYKFESKYGTPWYR